MAVHIHDMLMMTEQGQKTVVNFINTAAYCSQMCLQEHHKMIYFMPKK